MQLFWDERYGQLSGYVNEQLHKMDEHTPSEMKGLGNNLFVDEDLSEVVTRNFNHTQNELKELK